MDVLESTMEEPLVNCTPRALVKRRGSLSSGSKGSDGNERRQRKRSKPLALEEKFNKLDPKDSEHLKRIQQMNKDIAKGKNTAGYHAYSHQVPKEKRRIRSMETPSTPDANLDISKKRWQGLVKAWRIALHKYDPADLMNSFEESKGSVTGAAPIASATVSKDSLSLITPSSSQVPATPISKTAQDITKSKDYEVHDSMPSSHILDQSPISVLPESPAEKHSLSPFDDDDDDSDDDFL
ncbi:hypothetical protein FisN_1Lh122 [Fistulifera solaris]|uniref:Histone RNA hairpin-binding protein RNA-binding domain-containing protein n=1 Tax=Fistulifera solaris TaxID=1519565 RepID=A0A1Z5K5B5_FISSO|nr:hypothetical protein FisN_1Lh122 [Fistulifera solaris]|eukprot:GAX21291.1 hypothetical protein FisN_1Lh122 [Fistulifera solaris]